MLEIPQRVIDTRLDEGPLAPGSAHCFSIGGTAGIPASATGVIANVTALGFSAAGWLTVYPGGQPVPGSSTLNFDSGQTALANGTIVGLGSDGQLCISAGTLDPASGAAQAILDVVGYLSP